jgi:hypothetical protein
VRENIAAASAMGAATLAGRKAKASVLALIECPSLAASLVRDVVRIAA